MFFLAAQSNPDWTTPPAPYRVAGNLYYVGSKDLAAYLVVTPSGDVLINGNLPSSLPQIKKASKNSASASATSRSFSSVTPITTSAEAAPTSSA